MWRQSDRKVIMLCPFKTSKPNGKCLCTEDAAVVLLWGAGAAKILHIFTHRKLSTLLAVAQAVRRGDGWGMNMSKKNASRPKENSEQAKV